jgi:[ribosomal protein S5]-alanine N-acetyltransferase
MFSNLEPAASRNTARLPLRRPRAEDAAAIFAAYATDPEVTRYLVWQPHKSIKETEAHVARAAADWAAKREYVYAITVREEGDAPVGGIAVRGAGHQVSFGFVLGRAHWGRGIATEALSDLLGWTLGQRGIWRAAAFCDVDNLASARVMEKAGMSLEGINRRAIVHPNLSPEPRDVRMYAKVN